MTFKTRDTLEKPGARGDRWNEEADGSRKAREERMNDFRTVVIAVECVQHA
jgi:hypothetical protein